MNGAISLCRPGVPFSAIGGFIAPMAHREGFSVVRQFCGHGIGKIFHMPPIIYHCGQTRERQTSGAEQEDARGSEVKDSLCTPGVVIH